MLDYSRGKSAKLSAMLSNAKRSDSESMRLEDELAVARTLLDRALTSFDITCISPPDDPKLRAAITHDIQLQSMANVRAALKQVAELAHKYAGVLAVSEKTFNSRQVDMIMQEVTRVVVANLMDIDPVRCERILDQFQRITIQKKNNEASIAAIGGSTSTGIGLEFEESKVERITDITNESKVK